MGVVTAIGLGLAAAGVGMSAAGSRKASKAEKRAAAERSRLANMQADDILVKGQKEAEMILEGARQVRGKQITQMAAAGFVIGDGSSGMMLDTTEALAQADALVALADSKEIAKQVRAGAVVDASAASSRASAMRTQQYAALLNGASSMVNTYQRSQSLNNTTTAPTQVNTTPTSLGTPST